MAWKGEVECLSYGMPNKAVCPLFKRWHENKVCVVYPRKGVSGAAEGDGGLPEGSRVGGAGGKGDGSTVSRRG